MSEPQLPSKISSSEREVSFMARHPILARGWKDTWGLWKGQLIMSFLLSLAGVPYAVHVGILTQVLSLTTVWFFCVIYGAALLLTMLWSFIHAPVSLYRAEHNLRLGLAGRLEAEQAIRSYANLQGEIMDFFAHPMYRESINEFKGCVVVVKVYFTNIHTVRTGIRNYALHVNIDDVEYISAYPNEGELRQVPRRRSADGVIAPSSIEPRILRNLVDTIGTVAEHGTPFDGCLEFAFEDAPIGFRTLMGVEKLVITDSFNRTHELRYGRSMPLRPAEQIIAWE